ncbi:MAG: ABC transporter permease [Bacteroidales bacterium]|nr:ABC transporter permease [Bacteroidales bacterium]
MLFNYLKIAWRNIIRQKGFSFINIFGLAVAMAASIMLFLFIKHEKSYDRFHSNGERIYRVISSFGGDVADVLPRTLPGVAELLPEQSPLVANAVRIKPERYSVKSGDQIFESERFLMTDPSFKDLFDFPLYAGDLEQTLSDPSAVALSYELAKKLFGDQNAINEIIEAEQFYIEHESGRLTSRYIPVRVGAVFDPIPLNTHLQFSVLHSYESYDPLLASGFANDVFVYFKTHNVLSASEMENLSELIKEYALGLYGEEFRDIMSYSLQPLHDIHFGQRYGYDTGTRGNLEIIYVFSAVAFFILFIAIINFINLVTARSERRAVEAAIRKVAGARRSDIIFQFMGEAILVSGLALMISLVLAELLLGPFSSLLNRELSLLNQLDLMNLIVLILLAPLVGLLAGAYPSFMFSGYRPAEILRGKGRGGRRNPLLRIILVVVQFSISVILIVSIMVFNRQIQYMKASDLGFSPSNVLVYSGLSNRLISSFDAVKAELLQHPSVGSVTASQAYPGASGSGMSLRKADDDLGVDISVAEYRVYEDFHKTFGLNIKQGRWFDFESQTDRQNFVINETAAAALGLDDPIGQDAVMWQRSGKIIGVVEDFHISSLVNKITPLVLTAYATQFYYISVKLSDDYQQDVFSHIHEVFRGFDPNYNPEDFYLETYFHSLYRQEESNNKILNYASILAIIIAMLGVLGLSSYMVMARKREISIRKIMGASGLQVSWVLLRDIIRWVILANLIAWPVAWYLMQIWLQEFPYRINMSFFYLLIAGFISLLIAVITISGQTLQAARSNPVDTLKSE